MALFKIYTGSAWESVKGSYTAIDGQTIEGTVSNYDLVYHNGTQWVKSTSLSDVPVGMKIGSGIVCFEGYISGLTGLTAGSFYYMDSNGDLTTSSGDIKVGYSISTTELILDIDDKST